MSGITEHLKGIISEPEPDGVAPDGSAETEPVAEGVTADVAGISDDDGAAAPPDPSILPDELTDDERVRTWQSAVSKKQDAADARIAELEAQLASVPTPPPADDPLPALEKKRVGLLKDWQEMDTAMAEAKGADRDKLLIQQWQLRRAIFDADVAKFAYIHGADPEAAAFAEAYDAGSVNGPNDVERLALLVAKAGGGSTARADALDVRESALKEKEKAFADLLKTERAKIRREMGLDDVPGTTPTAAGKVTPEDKVLQEYRAIKASGDTGRPAVKKMIRLKLDHPEAFTQ